MSGPRRGGRCLDGRGDGCTIAALGGDAARQPADIKTEFAAGIENLLTALQTRSDTPGDAAQRATRTMVIEMLAHSACAAMLSRACPDGSPLADEILDVCRKEILASLAHGNSDQPAGVRSRPVASTRWSGGRTSSVRTTAIGCAPSMHSVAGLLTAVRPVLLRPVCLVVVLAHRASEGFQAVVRLPWRAPSAASVLE